MTWANETEKRSFGLIFGHLLWRSIMKWNKRVYREYTRFGKYGKWGASKPDSH